MGRVSNRDSRTSGRDFPALNGARITSSRCELRGPKHDDLRARSFLLDAPAFIMASECFLTMHIYLSVTSDNNLDIPLHKFYFPRRPFKTNVPHLQPSRKG